MACRPETSWLFTGDHNSADFDLRKSDEPDRRDRGHPRSSARPSPQLSLRGDHFFVETDAGESRFCRPKVRSSTIIYGSRRVCPCAIRAARAITPTLAEVPEPYAATFRNLLAHEGVEYVGSAGLCP